MAPAAQVACGAGRIGRAMHAADRVRFFDIPGVADDQQGDPLGEGLVVDVRNATQDWRMPPPLASADQPPSLAPRTASLPRCLSAPSRLMFSPVR